MAAHLLFLSGFKWITRIFNGLGVDKSGFFRITATWGRNDIATQGGRNQPGKSEISGNRNLPQVVEPLGASGVFIIQKRLRKRGHTTGVVCFRG